ncbi:aminotransferase class V-fold PLP-dependent enzyme [Porphyromonas sp. COT-290 OH3588]|uniref:aminotransferase class V-fold PLP-dependent enzyme n=1 Tax=Porphyromonas sp. COT-290 OH3588 TaxID=1515617 RepID=UPI00052D894C|nr:cysteine desulfurase [Porphyromonas sp. COT-290 OH3588]KGO00323.1 cysteine sulfinate desulfinase [Porphyromonas sp. COT-290 OH3588]
MYDIDKIRDEFPILHTQVHGRPLVYLDNGATTQKPLCVLEAIDRAYRTANANVHRGVHYLSQLATERHEEARRRVARFINASSEREVIFTRGTTEAINLVATSFGAAFVREGDEIVISTMEHHANIVPWQMLCQRTGARLRVIKINELGELDLEHYISLLGEKTKIVSLTHVSNVLGTINPIKQVIDLAHEHGIPVLIDGAQAIAHTKVDVQALGADFYVFSAHKVYGPTGVGVLYGRSELLDAMPPYMGGGEMIAKVTFEQTTYNELPFKYEAGTPDYVGSTALAAALDFVDSVGVEQIASYEDELLQYATRRLTEEFSEVYILGRAKHKEATISFGIGRIHPFDLGTILDRMGVAIRTGHHCAEPLLDRFGHTAIARASFAMYNTQEEVDTFISSLHRAAKMLL